MGVARLVALVASSPALSRAIVESIAGEEERGEMRLDFGSAPLARIRLLRMCEMEKMVTYEYDMAVSESLRWRLIDRI